MWIEVDVWWSNKKASKCSECDTVYGTKMQLDEKCPCCEEKKEKERAKV